MMTKKTKGAAYQEWLDDLRNRPRNEAAGLIADKYPHLSDVEIQRRLRFLDGPPAPSIKTNQTPPTKRVKKARNSLFRAMAQAMTSSTERQDNQSPKSLVSPKGASSGTLLSRRPVP